MPTTSMRCLAIGISDAPPLDFLPGAANGARAFGKWAGQQGIRTEILTDEEEPVGFSEVGAALDRLLSGGQGISRLLLYFAGHGFARDAAEDLWLLSKWHEEQRAIAVNALRRRLERFGIQQITVVGDACRSIPHTADAADLTADPVLGRGPFDRNTPRVDVLRASSSFLAAYMVMGETSDEDRCIFSGVLEEALQGAHADAFDPDSQSITNFSLATFLEQAVPARAEQYRVALRPDITTGLRPPDNIYVPAKPPVPPSLRPWPAAQAVGAMGTQSGIAKDEARGWSTRGKESPRNFRIILGRQSKNILGRQSESWMELLGPPRRRAGRQPEDDRPAIEQAASVRQQRADDLRTNYDREPRPTHFETGAGFSLDGARARRAVLGPHADAEDVREGVWWRIAPRSSDIWRHGDFVAPLPLLIELGDGRWAGAAMLPGYIPTFTIRDGGAASVIYRRIGHDPTLSYDAERAVADLWAGGLAADAVLDRAIQLRIGKEEDPIRGVLAAYLYDSLGDIDNIRRTAFFLAQSDIPIPFDMALLGRLPAALADFGALTVTIPATPDSTPRTEWEPWWNWRTTPAITAPVAGLFPWLRQGWALLDEDPSPLVRPGLARLQAEVLPFPFTTLTPRGGERLRQLIEEA